MSQRHNVKLRKLAAVLVELTIEAGPDTAASVVRRPSHDDPLVDMASERNDKRVRGVGTPLPAGRSQQPAEISEVLGDYPTAPDQPA